MSATAVSFKWLDILEKEFDKAYVNVDLILLGDYDGEEGDAFIAARKKLAVMCSCFSQLSHKALTIFQMHAKVEAELVNLRAEVVDLQCKNDGLKEKFVSLLRQLQAAEILNVSVEEAVRLAKDTFEIHDCPVESGEKELTILKNWKRQLMLENELLWNVVAGLQAEVCGARLAARYLDKELAGRIQQLQLANSEMEASAKSKLGNQLDAEILLQRHKTILRVMKPSGSPNAPNNVVGRLRIVCLLREAKKGLGISVTGGREHGVPILISALEPWCIGKNLYVGDAIFSVNGIDLNKLTHREAVKVLSEQMGNVLLTVKTMSDSNESGDDYDYPSYLDYPFYKDEENKVVYYGKCCEEKDGKRDVGRKSRFHDAGSPKKHESMKKRGNGRDESAEGVNSVKIIKEQREIHSSNNAEIPAINNKFTFKDTNLNSCNNKRQQLYLDESPKKHESCCRSSDKPDGNDKKNCCLENADKEDEEELFGVTTLQKIFRSVSAIEGEKCAVVGGKPKGVERCKSSTSVRIEGDNIVLLDEMGDASVGTPV